MALMECVNLILLKRVLIAKELDCGGQTHTECGGLKILTLKEAVANPFILFASVALRSDLHSFYTCTE